MPMIVVIPALLLCLFNFLGCQSAQSKAVEGAVVGTVIGAAAGGIIGHQSHHGGEGAAIGGAIGALSGTLLGSQIPKNQQGTTQGISSATNYNPHQLTIQQIVDLNNQGIADSVIIDKIRLSGSRYSLSADDIDYLRQHGVKQSVIDVMQTQR